MPRNKSRNSGGKGSRNKANQNSKANSNVDNKNKKGAVDNGVKQGEGSEKPLEEIKCPIEAVNHSSEEGKPPLNDIEEKKRPLQLEGIKCPLDITVPIKSPSEEINDPLNGLKPHEHIEQSDNKSKGLRCSQEEIRQPLEEIKHLQKNIEYTSQGFKRPLAGNKKPLGGVRQPVESDKQFLDAPDGVKPPLKEVEPLEAVKQSLGDVKQPLEVVKQPLEGVKQPLEGVKQSVKGVKPLEEVKQSLDGVKQPLEEVKLPPEEIKRPQEGFKSLEGMKESMEGVKRPLERIKHPLDNMKHPLEYIWGFWMYTNTKKNWEENLVEMTTFDTVEDFWCLYHHTKQPSELKLGQDYAIFKKGIRPMWEDNANKRGGRWLLGLEKRREELDWMWLDLVLLLIGNNFNHSDNICGVVVNVRAKCKISVWTADSSDQTANMEIGKKIRDQLNIFGKLGFQVHDSTKSLYTV